MARRRPSQYNWSKLQFDQTILTKHFTRQSSKNVRFIVVHHSTIIGDGSGSALTTMYNVWQQRPASAHYGVDGNLVRQYVWDKDYAWATGSTWGNRYGISIEHMNSTAGPGWRVAKRTWQTGARLAAQLHYHYGLGIPVAGKTLRKHSSFTSTACPGPYLGGRIWKKYVKEARRVYKKLAKGQPVGSPPSSSKGLFGMAHTRFMRQSKNRKVKAGKKRVLPFRAKNGSSSLLWKPTKDWEARVNVHLTGVPAGRDIKGQFVWVKGNSNKIVARHPVVDHVASNGTDALQFTCSGSLPKGRRLRFMLWVPSSDWTLTYSEAYVRWL